jgi:hypothetical protein
MHSLHPAFAPSNSSPGFVFLHSLHCLVFIAVSLESEVTTTKPECNPSRKAWAPGGRDVTHAENASRI